MVSGTNIKTKNNTKPRASWRGGFLKHRHGSSLTLRILAVNILPVIVLVIGLLSLGRYQDSLIDENLKTLQARAQNFAIAIEGPEDRPIIPEQARQTIRKLGQNHNDTRIILVNDRAQLVADSRRLNTGSVSGGDIIMTPLAAPDERALQDMGFYSNVYESLANWGTAVLETLPTNYDLPPFPLIHYDALARSFPDIALTLSGLVRSSAWEGGQHEVILTASAPIYKQGAVQGAVLIVHDGRDIERGMDRVRLDVLTATLAALSMTIFMSFYLAGLLGRPLRKLAKAAENVRHNKGREMMIPDMSRRGDEIGELSLALRDMTQALWDRMDSIERFAADVSHEIKNPLTSMKSAVETAARVDNEEDRKKLMDIIHDDVQRLDRLISDISTASRLDAAFSRDEMGAIDVGALLVRLADVHQNPLRHGIEDQKDALIVHIDVILPANRNVSVRGNESRLAQVFENLLTNAISFSPEGGQITVRVQSVQENICITIEDQGPGIPPNKIETIFERFYSERPRGEVYGRHSGLGLSISKQIIAAHEGRIYAENIVEKNVVKGASFTVLLKKII